LEILNLHRDKLHGQKYSGKRDNCLTPLVEFDQKILHLISVARYEEALWTAEEELYYAETCFGNDHIETAKVLNNLGWICDMLNKDAAAEEYYLKALETKILVCGGDSQELIPTLENLIGFLINRGKLMRARDFLEKLLELTEIQNKLWRLRKSIYLCQLADVEDELGFVDRAEALLWESLAFLQTNYGFEHPNTARVFAKLANFYEKHGNFGRAEYCYNRALKLLRKHFPGNHPDLKFIRDGLYNIYSELGINVKVP